MARDALDLVRLRVHEQLDRVADGVHPDEDEERHQDEHEKALPEAADGVGEHGEGGKGRAILHPGKAEPRARRGSGRVGAPYFAGLSPMASVYWSVRGV